MGIRLTTLWVDGARIGDLRAAGGIERTRAAADLLRFTWTELFAHGFQHADPPPGNFLFGDRVAVLDWGCVRRFAADEVEPFRALLAVLLADRRDRFRDALAATGTVPDFARYDLDAAWHMYRATFGVHALLTRLGVTLPARDLLGAALAAPLDPLPDPVGPFADDTRAADALRGPPRPAPPR